MISGDTGMMLTGSGEMQRLEALDLILVLRAVAEIVQLVRIFLKIKQHGPHGLHVCVFQRPSKTITRRASL